MEGESEKQDKRTLPKPGIRGDFFQRHYATHGRSFPWREEGSSPFGILVAEILLKQTYAGKVADGMAIPYSSVSQCCEKWGRLTQTNCLGSYLSWASGISEPAH